MRRPSSVVAALVVAWLALSSPALAKEYSLPRADVIAVVTADGALRVTEDLTYAFAGSFSGGYREIPLRPGETVTGIAVSEEGRAYTPGAPAEIGSSGAPGTFGVAYLGDRARVVWHYRAVDEVRTFEVSYTLESLAVAYTDVVDVNLRVWGEEWSVSLDQLEARVVLPGRSPGDVLVWGHPAAVSGFTELAQDGSGATLYAAAVPAGQWVEIRVVFPRALLRSTRRARVVAGQGLEAIVAEERAFAAETERDRRRLEWLKDNAPSLVPVRLLVAMAPAGLTAAALWRRYGREHPVPPAPLHLPEPPGNEKPALVAALLTESGSRATGNAFTATLFDLIRRGHLDAFATTTIKSTWAGIRRQEIPDLSLARKGPADELISFESDVLEAIDHARDGKERVTLTELREHIEKNPSWYAQRFDAFKMNVGEELRERAWWMGEGRWPTIVGAVVSGAIALLFAWIAESAYDPQAAVQWGRVALAVAAGIATLNCAIFVAFLLLRRGWERRSRIAAELAARWEAFRRFLGDFAGIPEAVPGSIAIWEQYLCYGIAFGVAERVLAAAQLHAPEALNSQSSVFWISDRGGLGAGRSAFAIGEISNAISSAAQSSSGGGWGFGGGGGGGGGRGGGGAW